MGVKIRIRNGLQVNESTGLGGANEGYLRGHHFDLIENVGGVVDLAGGHALVHENSPAAMNVIVDPGVVYIPNADFDEMDADTVKFWEAVIDAAETLTIGANSSGSTRIDLICVKMDTAIVPDEYASNIASLVVVEGTPGAGVPTTPDNHYKLAEVEVVNGETVIEDASITDSREQLSVKDAWGGGGGGGGDSNSFIVNETPTGTINGTNAVFTLAQTPIASSEKVFVDGQLQKGGGNDYTLSGATITFVDAPDTDSVILVDYMVAGVYSQNADTVDGAHASATPAAGIIPILNGVGHLPMTAFPLQNGAMINGKLAVSVVANDLVVAIKGYDGNDPSATNPVYIIINNIVRTLTSALSVTVADGANSFNSGSTELAAKEVDYFAYIIWKASNSTIVLGISRIPYGSIYSDFSGTATNEKYIAVSATPASSDECQVVGRFAATLSAGAAYTWTVPTFTPINLVQRPIYETRWLTWLPVYSSNGSMTFTSVTGTAIYQIVGRTCYIVIFVTGTTGGSDTTGIVATLPMSSFAVDSCMAGMYYDGTVGGAAVGTISSSPNYSSMTFYKYNTSNWGLGANRSPRITTNYRLN